MAIAERIQTPKQKEKPTHSIAKKIAPLLLLGLTAVIPDAAPNISTPHYIYPSNTLVSSREAERQVFTPMVTILDYAPAKPTKGISQDVFVTNEELLRKLLDNEPITKKLKEEYGNDYIKDFGPAIAKNFPFIANENNILTVIYKSFNFYFDHGENIANEMNRSWRNFGMESQNIRMIPLQSILDKKSLTLIKDKLGNPGISLEFDHQRIIGLLETDENRIVNMSFQVGDVQIFLKKKEEKKFDPPTPQPTPPTIIENDNPSTQIFGAYRPEAAFKNLSKLFEIAKAYPDKLFIAAAGNEKEDIRSTLEILQGLRPENLLIVAEWKENKPEREVYGADIYVDNTALQLHSGSSSSVPAVSSYAEVLFQEKFTMKEVISMIKLSSQRTKYTVDGKENETLLFDPRKLYLTRKGVKGKSLTTAMIPSYTAESFGKKSLKDSLLIFTR